MSQHDHNALSKTSLWNMFYMYISWTMPVDLLEPSPYLDCSMNNPAQFALVINISWNSLTCSHWSWEPSARQNLVLSVLSPPPSLCQWWLLTTVIWQHDKVDRTLVLPSGHWLSALNRLWVWLGRELFPSSNVLCLLTVHTNNVLTLAANIGNNHQLKNNSK